MKEAFVLFNINDWRTLTSEMDADARGWYLNLILHIHTNGSLPIDIEKLSIIAGVKPSEYLRFVSVFEEVLIHKFDYTYDGRITNLRTAKILKERKTFQDKRIIAGKLSYFFRWIRRKYPDNKLTRELKEFIKNSIDINNLNTKEEHLLKQLYENLYNLYISENFDALTENKIEPEQNEVVKKPEALKVTRVRKTKDIPENLEVVIEYFLTKGSTKEEAKYFYDYYESGNWVDNENKPVLNWRRRAVTWINKSKIYTSKNNKTLFRNPDYYDNKI